MFTTRIAPLTEPRPATRSRAAQVVTAVGLFALLSAAGADAQQCIGDCDLNGQVEIGELVLSVNIALGNTIIQACRPIDRNGDETASVNELILAVSAALNGCPIAMATATPTLTSTSQVSPTTTASATVTASVTSTSTAIDTATPTRTPTLTATPSATATPTPPPSVELDVVLGPDPVQPGGVLQVAIVATNSGQSDLLDVEIETTIPNQVDAFAPILTGGALCTGGVSANCERTERVIWSVGTLRAGAAVRVSMPPRVSAGASAPADGTAIDIQAMLRAGGRQIAMTGDSVSVDADPVLLLDLQADADPVAPGGTLTYTLTFSNRQLAVPATAAVLRMPLPPGTTLVDASDGGELMDDTVEWDVGTVAPGDAGVRELTVAVDAQLDDGEILSAEAAIEDAAGERAEAAEVTQVQMPSALALAMELAPETLRLGESAPVALTVTNSGTTTLLDVTAEIVIPDGIANFTVPLVPGGSCPDAFNSAFCQPRERMVWTIGTLAPGAGVTVAAVPSAVAEARDGTLLTFNAVARAGGGLEVATSRTAVIQSDPVLELELREDADPVAPGGALTYTLHFGNRQLAVPAAGAVLRMPMPAGTAFVAASDGGTLVDGVVEWALGTVGPGQVGVRQLTVAAATSLPDGALIRARAELGDTVAADRVRANAATRVRETPPLTLTMELNPDTLRPSETAQVALTVTNTGPIALLNVTAELVLPDGLANTQPQLVPGGSCPDAFNSVFCQPRERLVWPIGTLPPGAGVTVASVPGALPDARSGSLLTFNALARAGGGLEVSTSRTLAIQDDPVLELELRENIDPVVPGGDLTYTLHFSNRQLAVPATGTVLRLPVPPGTEIVAASDGGTLVDGVVEWALGTVGPGEAGVRELTVAVDSARPDGALIHAEATLADAVASRRVRANAATRVQETTPLTLTMELAPEPLRPGETAQVALTVTNTGPIALLDVEAEVILPDGLANTQPQLVPGGSCPDAFSSVFCQPRERLLWAIGTLAPGAGVIVASVPGALPDVRAGSLLTFNAFARAGGGVEISTSRTVAIQADPVLELELREDADPIPPGGTFTYTLAFANRQTATLAQNVTLHMPLPAGTDLVAASDGGTLADGVIEWTLGTVGPGEAGIRQLTVAAGAALPDGAVIPAQAELGDSVASRRVRANVVTRVLETTSLRLAMELNPGPLRPGETAHLALTVTNTGPITLLDVEAEVILPDGLANLQPQLVFGGLCPDAFSSVFCQARERLVWSIGTLAPGAGVSVTSVPGALADARPGSLLTFNAVARQGSGEEVSTSRTLAIQADPVLELALREDLDPVTPGGDLTYTLAFGNRQAVTSAQNVTVRMPVPPGTEFVAVTDGGTLADGVVEWDLGTLAPGEAGGLMLMVAVDDQLADGTLLPAAAEIADDVAARRVTANAVTRVNASTPLTVSIETDADVVTQGVPFQVRMRVASSSPIDLLGVTAAVVVPDGIANFLPAAISGGTCPDAFSSAFCQARERVVGVIPTLQPGAEMLITFPVTVAASTPSGTVLVFNGSGSDAGGNTVDATRAVVVGGP